MMASAQVIVETERLWLREFTEGDAPAFFALNSHPEVMRYTGDNCLGSVEQARKGLLERPIADYRTYGFGRWAAIFKENASLIGFAGLKYLDDLGEVDLGYRFLPEYWGRGLATEASRAALTHGFDVLRLKRILGLVDPPNVRSIRVLEKLGFVFDTMIEYRAQEVAQYVVERRD